MSLFFFTLYGVMVLVAGPYVFSGPTKYGGYNSNPTSFDETLFVAVIGGLLGALAWPFLNAAKGQKTEM